MLSSSSACSMRVRATSCSFKTEINAMNVDRKAAIVISEARNGKQKARGTLKSTSNTVIIETVTRKAKSRAAGSPQCAFIRMTGRKTHAAPIALKESRDSLVLRECARIARDVERNTKVPMLTLTNKSAAVSPPSKIIPKERQRGVAAKTPDATRQTSKRMHNS